MPRGTRDALRIEARRLKASDLYLSGVTSFAEIARRVGVDRSQLSRDFQVIREWWKEKYAANLDAAKQEELAKVDQLEKTYWKAWRRSCRKRTILGRETKTTPTGTETKRSHKLQKRDGNPAFLEGVERCIKRRCEILGLDAPIKTENKNLNWDVLMATVPAQVPDEVGQEIEKPLLEARPAQDAQQTNGEHNGNGKH